MKKHHKRTLCQRIVHCLDCFMQQFDQWSQRAPKTSLFLLVLVVGVLVWIANRGSA